MVIRSMLLSLSLSLSLSVSMSIVCIFIYASLILAVCVGAHDIIMCAESGVYAGGTCLCKLSERQKTCRDSGKN